ncbi:7398_t:CDS:2 [Entrophospora sp. SA101]|nr:7398_t:CDS:2 [Entrophospora sp. SA101]
MTKSNELSPELELDNFLIKYKLEKAQSYLVQLRVPENRNFFELELHDQLKLNPEENFYVVEEVLEREEVEGGITLKNEAAATIGAVAGGLGGGTTGLMAGLAFDKLSNSEKIRIKSEIKSLLEDYKTVMEEKSRDCQDIINNEVSGSGEKEESQKQKENYDNEVREIVAYIENNNN